MRFSPRCSVALLAVTVAGIGVAGPAQAGTLDRHLQDMMTVTGTNETVSGLVYLLDRFDSAALGRALTSMRVTREVRHNAVVTGLRDTAAATQGELVALLERLVADGEVVSFKPYWVTNCIRVDATPAAFEVIRDHPDVDVVYLNYGVELVAPVGGVPGQSRHVDDLHTRSPEIGLVAIKVPEVWELGFTGEGILVATLDTGVDGDHEALETRWRGASPFYAGHPEWAWFDPVTSTTFPQSFGAHGTHTMGTVCGGAPGDDIGVAPGAEWIHAAVIDRVDIPTTVADAIEAFQWMLNPDENDETFWDVPHVCSNSWRVTSWHGYPPCDETFWTYLDNCEEAGIVILFSAGNEGPGAETIGRPPDRATDELRTFAVGAVDGNDPDWPIAGFSSRGPSHCTPDGSEAIKPEVVAPGVDVRSSVPGGGYQSSGWSGTSMASPHVNGVVALMRQACPDLPVADIKQILLDTAYDLGTEGNDNTYGYGMVDALAAVELALEMCAGPPKAEGGHYDIAVGSTAMVTMSAIDWDEEPDPPGMITFKVVSLPAAGNTLTDPATDHVITEGDLPYALADGANVLMYTPAGDFYGEDAFVFVADDGGEPPDAGESEPATITFLVKYGPPQILTATLPEGSLVCPYGPVTMTVDEGQPEMTWLVAGANDYDEASLLLSLFQFLGTAQGWTSDEGSWNYTLPFAFPFYGQDYTSVTVSANGFLNFGTWTGSAKNNSDALLIANKRIAPLWDDLRTDLGGNVYIFASSSVVIIRWAAFSYSDNEPVNVSCALYADGRIRFNYGPGNVPITPTIGISKGDGVNYLLSQYNGATELTYAPTLQISPPDPLPEGVTLSADGVLSGMPLEAGEFQPKIRVIDALDRVDTRQLTLVIHAGPYFGAGDMNCDCVVDFTDINAFVLALSNPGAYAAAYPDCDRMLADVNGDGVVDFKDINPFVLLLTQ